MADRTSAGLFGTIFQLLAENPTDEYKSIARKIYNLSHNYDFNQYQMDADEACVKLGIARMGINPYFPDEGKQTLWPEDDGYNEADII